MKFIKRIPITAGMISNEQAQQTDLWYTNESGALVAVAPWVSGQNVATGDRRSHDQKVWQALNTHASTAEPDLSPTLWAFVAPTNRWAAFDDAVGSATQETGSISFTLTPGERFDSFGCLGMQGSSLIVDVEDPNANFFTDFVSRTLPSARFWSSVTYGGGLFIAVAVNSDLAATSTDGINWIQTTLPSAQPWRSVTYGNGLFVAVADGNVAATSTDGINWTSRTLPSEQNWRSVTYGGGLFVAVQSSTSVAATSTDGINWTSRTLPSSQTWYSVTYGSGLFVAVAIGSNVAATSTDGINWTQRTLPSARFWSSVTYGGGLFVAVAVNSDLAATSTDGINWIQTTLPSAQPWRSVTYGNGLFVAVADGNVAATSTDGINWTSRTLPSEQTWYSVTYGSGLFVAVAIGSNVAATATYSGTFYTTTIPLIEDEEPVIDFWTYCFAGFKQKENILVTGLNSASYTTARIKITISGATTTDPVKLGTFNFGMVQVLGITEMGMKTGITNYSSYNVDQFGVTRIIPQTFAKKINANVMVDRAGYNTVFQSLVDYKDTAVIVFPSDSEDYSKAITYGHIREWSLSIDYPTYTMLPIEVRGLT
jgi:hypothetical protein